MNLLSYDSPISQIIRRIGNLIILNICYIVCCLPVVTIGVATAALYAACMCDPDAEWPVLHFFRSLKTNFRQATLIWLILLVPTVAICAGFYLSGVLQIWGYRIIQVLLCILALVLGSVVSFVFPLQARYDNSVKHTLRNALVFSLGAPIPGVFMQVLALLPIIVFFLDLNIFIWIFSLWMIIGFSGVAFINSKICLKIFARIPSDSSE